MNSIDTCVLAKSAKQENKFQQKFINDLFGCWALTKLNKLHAISNSVCPVRNTTIIDISVLVSEDDAAEDACPLSKLVDSAQADPLDWLIAQERSNEIQKLYESLPQKSKEIWDLHLDGHDNLKIAQDLDMNVDAVQKCVSRVKSSLQGLITQ